MNIQINENKVNQITVSNKEIGNDENSIKINNFMLNDRTNSVSPQSHGLASSGCTNQYFHVFRLSYIESQWREVEYEDDKKGGI